MGVCSISLGFGVVRFFELWVLDLYIVASFVHIAWTFIENELLAPVRVCPIFCGFLVVISVN